MKNHIHNILKSLEIGEINTDKAIRDINNIDKNYSTKVRKASKLKITIIDKAENQNIRIPAIPFWLLDLLISLGMGLGSIALRFVDSIDEETRKILETIDSKDLKKLSAELKRHGPFDMVDIKEGDNTEIKIRIL